MESYSIYSLYLVSLAAADICDVHVLYFHCCKARVSKLAHRQIPDLKILSVVLLEGG